ncbi:DsbA family protein [Streptomyces sp. ISL-44]|uniref:thioredoxin domain-containing protein n=1 Tax=Streptomyces sp. ISL-44 TaxID=2819184 RepID=UPI001BEB1B52|nr:thioredoxin domain-containing protein [Streptomyces sp. ISL-44]MBT2544846.1 DsbA family protein [Streptomyces sp. ISL-44]
MSARNSEAAKAAARERRRAEREGQAKQHRARRRAIVAGVVIATLALAGGVGFTIVKAGEPGVWEKAARAELVRPKNTEGKNGTTVVIGKPEAKKTLELYEDSRCPACGAFEQAVGRQIKRDVDAGKFKLRYIGATFIDNGDKGEGSKNALSALGAALNIGPDAFLSFKNALYSAKNHPSERDDRFAEDAYLLQIADEVPALKGSAEFKSAVEHGTYDRWALEMNKAFKRSGVKGTPMLKMDGKEIKPPSTPEGFTEAIAKALQR